MKNNIPDNWYENFFSGINCEMWEKAATPGWTNAEVILIKDVLGLRPPAKILDMPCGTGRHSLQLAEEGFQVTAVDISTEFLNGLRSKAEKQSLPVSIIEADILKFELRGSFDGAYCLGNSFGYFNYSGMQTFVKKVASSLTQNARWIINTGLLAESFLAKFIPENKYELDGLTMEIKNDYDEWSSCLLTTLTYTKNNQQETHCFKHYIFTLAEIIRLLNMFGLETIAVYNSTNKDAYQLGDAQAYIVAEKK
jgi:cyclopropane fatty-acyl-phospholipid synthase-like methyltransferase